MLFRSELAAKEAAEVRIIEAYLPQAAGEQEILATVRAAIAEMSAAGTAPGMKDMGLVMKSVMAKFSAAGARVDGKAVSDTVKRELTPKQ